MLNLESVHRQVAEFGAYHIRHLANREIKLHRAREVFDTIKNVENEVLSGLVANSAERLIADPNERLDTMPARPDRPSPVTVVATDGSQIYPDRHIEPICYLLNVSRIAFQYGTLEYPVLETVPRLYFRGQDLSAIDGVDIEVAGREIVSALRDALELDELFNIAEAARMPDRPLLAIADGTMIRWMLRGMGNRDVEAKLLKQYTDRLEAFRDRDIPICSYLSMPASRDVVNLLSLWGTENLNEQDGFLDSVSDRLVYDRILDVGQRSSIFRSRSLVLKEYPEAHQICSFYIKVKGASGEEEVGRVEFPSWMLEKGDYVDLVHAVVCSETEKGAGYPMILSEAHEHAVVRGDERSVFYQMIERELIKEGVAVEGSLKKASKDRPIV